MIDILTLVAVLLVGLSLGAFFFGGLLWTIERGLSTRHPAFWFLGSYLIRYAVVLGAFYLVSSGRWERLVVCVVGFFIARIILIRFTRLAARPSRSKQDCKEEAGDATKS